METINIGYGHMALGFLLLIIPTYFLYRYRTGLVKDTLWAALRMTVQLFFIGFYLEYLFLWDSLWINLLWVVLMIVIASSTVLKRTKLPQKMLWWPSSCRCSSSTSTFWGWWFGPKRFSRPATSSPSAA